MYLIVRGIEALNKMSWNAVVVFLPYFSSAERKERSGGKKGRPPGSSTHTIGYPAFFYKPCIVFEIPSDVHIKQTSPPTWLSFIMVLREISMD